MAKLRHIAITVTDPWKTAEFYMRDFVGVHHIGFLVEDVDASRRAIEAAGGRHWSGEAIDGGGSYEVKFHDPDGLVFDITENGWAGSAGAVAADGGGSGRGAE